MMTQRLLLSTQSFHLLKPHNFDPNPFHFYTSSLPLFNSRALTLSISVNGRRRRWRVNSFPPRQSRSSPGFASKDDFFFVQVLILFAFSSVLLVLRLFSAVLLPDFPRRWRNLLTFSQEAEDRTCDYPSHVWEAIVAYEDRRFFKHFGVDPVGIARAAVSFSALGGGSTITQQVTFL
ncbi:Glycosyl transferase [Trema orientale]|uniref:Glycosyl transferase n=1 Tax=Trema orientale TaxID=63057 RepID=A0A2P5E5Q5_TREOI|nr:Glycosyl transferase [Trema orientale]